ncbi:MAG: ribonuclease H-like domain-containing protein [Planctomycetes bacterium]|nr:ribonuclease H-like domain-containing protein [Planctomycetota bacterium]
MVAPTGGGRSRRDKLRRAFRGEAEQRAAEQRQREQAAPPLGSMRAFLQQRRQRLADGLPASAPRAPVTLPDAEVVATEHGPLWLRQLRYPLTHVHGEVPLGAGARFDGVRLAKMAKSPSFEQLRPDECLFLDTETTGLAGGAGTVVFAYGIAFFEADELVFEQLFLRDFAEEPAMLHHLTRRLREHPVPVTFVGKSYDRHRIAARLAVHKITAPVLTDRHLDLYHVIRREFGKQWPDSRLRTSEEQLLGLFREHDLPGSEAPAAFLDWIRDGTGPVDRVLEHNRIDVLSLCALLGVVTAPRVAAPEIRSRP